MLTTTRISAFAICLLFASVTFCQEPQPQPTPNPTPVAPDVCEAEACIVLKAPERAKVGELVVLDVSESVATSFKWDVSPTTQNFLIIDGGKRLVFSSSEPGEFTFTVAAANKDTVALAIHRIRVTGGPAPDNGTVSKVVGWCKQVQTADPKAEASRLATSFETVASFAELGVLESPADLVAATRKANQDALGGSLEQWKPFFEQLQKELTAQAQAGKLNDVASHAPLWRAIAEGLRSFAEAD